ncbi:MAG TPA: RNA polymerase sigma-70 factor [Dysgonomonas sp.]|nr:RNA polymerase sigma-70 factor [Dysgonomonas sp.]
MEKHSKLTAFNDLYTEFRPRFIRFANSYVRDAAVAEDLTMEAFVTYWENMDTLLPGSNPAAYMLTVIRNKCLNHLEHIKVKNQTLNTMGDLALWELGTRIMSLEACNPDRLFSDEIQEIVEKTLAGLNERSAMIFRLSRDKNLSNKEIADMLGITVKGVEFHISKVLAALRHELKDYFPLYLLLFYLQ